jgi:hypothetical protein
LDWEEDETVEREEEVVMMRRGWWRSRHSLYLLDISVCALLWIDGTSLIATFGEALLQTKDS